MRPISELPSDVTSDKAPLVVLHGEHLKELPADVYIPPSTLNVLLRDFEGPLDLLLYFVRRENIDILDINLEHLTKQYLEYIDLMKQLQMEPASEYLVMAATLTEYKSRMLVPQPKHEEEVEPEDARTELTRRLMEYERYKNAAETMDALPRMERELHQARAHCAPQPGVVRDPDVSMRQLLSNARRVIAKMERQAFYNVRYERLSLRERMGLVMAQLTQCGGFVQLGALCDAKQGRAGVITTVMALMELVQEDAVELIQVKTYGTIQARARASTP